MSHVVLCNFRVHDVDSLAAAVKRLGGALLRGQSKWRWFEKFMNDSAIPKGFRPEDYGRNAEHVIRFPDCSYDIGVYKARDGKGGYVFLHDAWQGGYGLDAKVGGSEYGLLKQAYAVVRAKRALAAQGKTAVEKRLPSGQIQLVCQA